VLRCAFRWLKGAGDDLKQSRFAGPVGSDDAEGCAFLDFERDVTQRPEFPVRPPATARHHLFKAIGSAIVNTILLRNALNS
jgi:hypothetical protein